MLSPILIRNNPSLKTKPLRLLIINLIILKPLWTYELQLEGPVENGT